MSGFEYEFGDDTVGVVSKQEAESHIRHPVIVGKARVPTCVPCHPCRHADIFSRPNQHASSCHSCPSFSRALSPPSMSLFSHTFFFVYMDHR